MSATLRIGTRKSDLAMAQVLLIQRLIEDLGGSTTSLVPIVSSGDINLVQPLYELGAVGVFTKELDIALLNHQIDIAVHSFKDVPTSLPSGISVLAIPQREDRRDTLIAKVPLSEFYQKEHRTIATSSLRRQSIWLKNHPTDKVVPIRGNIQTRIKKFHEDEHLDGIILATAGLLRCQITPAHSECLDWMLPAPAQGALLVTCRTEDLSQYDWITSLNHPATYVESLAEKEILKQVGGGCSTPLGVQANVDGEEIKISTYLGNLNGSECVEKTRTGSSRDWMELCSQLGANILKNGGAQIIKDLDINHG